MQTDCGKGEETYKFIREVKNLLSRQESTICDEYRIKNATEIFKFLLLNIKLWTIFNKYFLSWETFKNSVVVKCYDLQDELFLNNRSSVSEFKLELLKNIDIILKVCLCNKKIGKVYCKNKKTGNVYCTFHSNMKKKIVSNIKETTEQTLYSDVLSIVSDYVSLD